MFEDRDDAARQLAQALVAAQPQDPVVLALPRGGVPLGVVAAAALKAPLDLLLVRKIGMPGHEELAAGAVVGGPKPITLFNAQILRAHGLRERDFESRVDQLLTEIERRRALYLSGRSPVDVRGRTAILVDDGIATGATIRVAIRALRARGPLAVWLAVPVAPRDTLEQLREEADHVVCLETPVPFFAVGAHYRRFGQVSDDEVVRLMSDG